MRILVFATVDADGDTMRKPPYVAIPDLPSSALPPHPDGKYWSYFVTTALGDVFIKERAPTAQKALGSAGHVVFDELRTARILRFELKGSAAVKIHD